VTEKKPLLKSDLQVYLLAGGHGKRAGGPKAWLPVEGVTLLEKQIAFLLKRYAPENIAVTIQDGWQKRCLKIDPKVVWVPEDPRDPPMAALITLIKKQPIRHWAFFYHVDMPVWEPELFEMLEKAVPAAEKEGLEAIAPSQGGRKGHPVLLAPQVGSVLVTLDPAKDRLDEWLRTRREGTIEVPFSCIHDNWNTMRQVG